MSAGPSLDAPPPNRANGHGARLRFQSTDWRSVTNLPPRPELIRNVISKGGMSVPYGESGCTKTFFAQNTALHLALGWEWNGCPVERCGVLYIAAEGGKGSITPRLIAFKAHHGIFDEGEFHFITEPPDLCNSSEDVDAIIAEAKQLKAGLIVIDTLSRCLGGGNENGPEDMGRFVGNCDRIRHETGAHVMIVHHTGKDGSRGARGHSLLRAATDTEIEIKRDDTTKVATATITKQRDGESGQVFPYRLKVIEIGTDEFGDAITSCVIEPCEGEASKPVQRGPAGQAKIALDLLRNAVAEHGEAFTPGGNFKGTFRSISVGHWRAAWKAARGHQGDTDEAIKKSFQRSTTKLQEHGIVGIWNGNAFIIGDKGT